MNKGKCGEKKRFRLAARATAAAAVLAFGAVELAPAANAAGVRSGATAPAASDGRGPADGRISEATVEAALARLRADALVVEPDAQPESSRAAGATSKLARDFGKRFMGGVAGNGEAMALDLTLKALGYDPDEELFNALADIKGSIQALDAEIGEIRSLMMELLHENDKQNFYNSYTQAGIAANRINTVIQTVSNWIDKGLQPSEQNVTDVHTVLRSALSDVSWMYNNEVTGVLPFAMKAEAAHVMEKSGIEAYHARIGELRSNFRSVLAQGIAGLELIERWDRDGTIAADRALFAKEGVKDVRAAYSTGLLQTGTFDQPYVTSQGGGFLLGPRTTSADGIPQGWSRVTAPSQIVDQLRDMSKNYGQDNHGGRTLERLMKDNGVAHAYWIGNHRHDAQRVVGFGTKKCIDVRLIGNFIEVQGNGVREWQKELTRKDCAYSYGWSLTKNRWVLNSQADKDAADSYYSTVNSTWSHRARYNTIEWHQTGLGHITGAMLRRTTALNVGGWDADFTKARAEQEAFGT